MSKITHGHEGLVFIGKGGEFWVEVVPGVACDVEIFEKSHTRFKTARWRKHRSGLEWHQVPSHKTGTKSQEEALAFVARKLKEEIGLNS